MAAELATVGSQLDMEKAKRLDAQKKRKEAETCPEAFKGDVADVLMENAALRATLQDMEKTETDSEEDNEEAKHGEQEKADTAPLGTQ